ncbi:hypothetical protein BU14_0109s0047 [Porphyra umbilicalis]|uniref:Uncharacterized protein n=1 Tax=Porphyra umbilicalis TaxID=2786 RepID=A0A1X6PC48_PORUM|nr:hypothetical protein BU14_0109s0047 [Porphyra umbilicalis]|eukprot:OSX78448.1 hypothetical protein BU14_0109s0047 [Porphyra umbilicalis]
MHMTPEDSDSPKDALLCLCLVLVMHLSAAHSSEQLCRDLRRILWLRVRRRADRPPYGSHCRPLR